MASALPWPSSSPRTHPGRQELGRPPILLSATSCFESACCRRQAGHSEQPADLRWLWQSILLDGVTSVLLRPDVGELWRLDLPFLLSSEDSRLSGVARFCLLLLEPVIHQS